MDDKRYIPTIWQIMEESQNATQLDELLASSLDILCTVLPCAEANLWMLNEEDQRLYIVSCRGEKDYSGFSVDKDQGVFGALLAIDETRVITNVNDIDMIQTDKDIRRLFSENALIVPLEVPNHTLGLLQFNNKEGGFTAADCHLAENCAAILALDIEDKGFNYNPNQNKTPLVSLRNIIKEFPSGEEIRRIIDGIDIDIYQGELLVILGESGCGKSTLLNIIGGMDTMSSGELFIEGEDFSHPTEKELTDYRRDYIGFIFQAYNLMPNLSALENVRFIAEVAKDPMDSQEALELVGLGDRGNRYPSAMSGGQQQRVCIARAIVKRPKLILADEPTAALDFTTGQGVLKVIEKVVQQQGTTVIMVTHNVEIAKMANRVIKLKNGKINSIRVNMHPKRAEELVW